MPLYYGALIRFGKVSNGLIIGCSFAGPSFIPLPHKRKIEKTDFSSVGYWGFLNKKNTYDVYNLVGRGYLDYFVILKQLGEKLKSYDFILIQETIEPRVSFFPDLNDVELYEYDNVKLHRLPGTTLYTRKEIETAMKLYEKYLHKGKAFSFISKRFINDAVSKVNFLLKSFDIPTFCFSFGEPFWKHSFVKRLEIPLVCNSLMYDEKYHHFILEKYKENHHIGHLNITGNKKLGNMLHESLIKQCEQYI